MNPYLPECSGKENNISGIPPGASALLLGRML